MVEEILCEARRQKRSIVDLCEHFGVRRFRAKFTRQNDFLQKNRRIQIGAPISLQVVRIIS